MQFLLIDYDWTDAGALDRRMKPSCTNLHNKKMKIMKVLPINRDMLYEQLNLQ
jgi:hypothetical protein